MALLTLLNPYTYVAGGVVVAAIAGSFYYQSTQIHKYHKAFDGAEHQIVELETTIAQMTRAQKDQTKRTDDAVTRVITVPSRTQTIIKTIHDAPIPADCKTPAIDTIRNET